jgi:hypothetical protein
VTPAPPPHPPPWGMRGIGVLEAAGTDPGIACSLCMYVCVCVFACIYAACMYACIMYECRYVCICTCINYVLTSPYAVIYFTNYFFLKFYTVREARQYPTLL